MNLPASFGNAYFTRRRMAQSHTPPPDGSRVAVRSASQPKAHLQLPSRICHRASHDLHRRVSFLLTNGESIVLEAWGTQGGHATLKRGNRASAGIPLNHRDRVMSNHASGNVRCEIRRAANCEQGYIR